MKKDARYREARAWFYTFKSEIGFEVESRTGRVIYRAATWKEAQEWAGNNLELIDDHENAKS